MAIREFMHRMMGREKAVALAGDGVEDAAKQIQDDPREAVPQNFVVDSIAGKPILLKPKKYVVDATCDKVALIYQYLDNETVELHYLNQETGETIFTAPQKVYQLRLARIKEIPGPRLGHKYKDDGSVDTEATILKLNSLGYF